MKQKSVKQFCIPFTGLKDEIHQFNFEIDKTFFEYFESEDINDAALNVELIMDKQSRLITMEFVITGFLNINCDRCLDAFDHRIDLNRKIFFKFGQEADEQADDVIILAESDYELDLAPHIYDFTILELPIRKEHPLDDDGEETCNPEFVERINKLSSRTGSDPRWEALSEIKKQNYGTSEKENLENKKR